MVQIDNVELVTGERPSTRRRPFAMDLDTRRGTKGGDLPIPEGSAPVASGLSDDGYPSSRQNTISRPRSAPPADKMTSHDGAALRSKSARARKHRRGDASRARGDLERARRAFVEPRPNAALATPDASGAAADPPRPRPAPRRDGLSPSNPRRREDAVLSELGLGLLYLCFVHV